MLTVAEIRLANLQLLVNELGTLDAVATAAGSSSVYLSQIRKRALDIKTGKPRSLGSLMARRMEDACDKPRGWMDTPHPPAPSTPGPDRPAALTLTVEERELVLRIREIAKK